MSATLTAALFDHRTKTFCQVKYLRQLATAFERTGNSTVTNGLLACTDYLCEDIETLMAAHYQEQGRTFRETVEGSRATLEFCLAYAGFQKQPHDEDKDKRKNGRCPRERFIFETTP